MSLLLITERFAPDLGGVARSARRIALSLKSLQVDVHVLAWTRTLPPGELVSEDHDGVRVHRLGLFAHWDLSLQHSLNVMDWLQQQFRFELVWGHYLFPAGFLAVFFAGLHGLRSTVSARGNDVDRLMFPPGDFARLLWTLQRADLITAVSQELRRKIEVLLAVPSQEPIAEANARCVVSPNVVDTHLFSATATDIELQRRRTELGVQPDEIVLGFCGELRQKKGMSFLLQAFVEVRRRYPATLLVIGDVRPREQAELTSFAAIEPSAAEHIRVTGHLDDPAAVAFHLQLCDLVLLPSVWDGMPNSVLEAMACERIVIASDAGGIPEMIEHGQDGFLIPKSQLHRLGEACLEVIGLPIEERQQLGRAARTRVLREFTAGDEQRRLAEVLRLVCETRLWS